MFKLGLTGSIGMGKSTTADMFADAGCAVWDADAAVHRLYDKGGAAVAKFARVFPSAVIEGRVDRAALKNIISSNSNALQEIETIVHPLVREDREQFINSATADILVFDIPLLFETGSETEFDAVACVFVDADTQKARVMARGTMSEAQFMLIKSKQLPAAEKAQRADFVITTDTLEHACQQVHTIIAQIRETLAHA